MKYARLFSFDSVTDQCPISLRKQAKSSLVFVQFKGVSGKERDKP
jgi:hypothetical protein